MLINEWLDRQLGTIPLGDLLHALAMFIAVWGGVELLFRAARRTLPALVNRLLRYKHSLADDLVAATRRGIFPVIALGAALQQVPLGPWQHKVASILVAFGVLYQVLRYANCLVEFFINRATAPQGDGSRKASIIGANLIAVAKVMLATIGVLFVLDNSGVNVSTFVAGLGVGGIAVALAAQAVLGDAFGSFSISLDRPFEIGDFIVTGDVSGNVESVGLKTTRIRALSGEMVVIPNAELSKARIQNFRKLVERRVVFKLKLAIETTPTALGSIPQLIKNAVVETKGTRFDRAHLAAIDDAAFTFEVVWFALTADYNAYMDMQQAIYLKVLGGLEAHGYVLAVPVQQAITHARRPVGRGLGAEMDRPDKKAAQRL